jgi:hypothetical protein
MNGILALVGIGCIAFDVGVPTGMINANTLPSLMSFLTA